MSKLKLKKILSIKWKFITKTKLKLILLTSCIILIYYFNTKIDLLSNIDLIKNIVITNPIEAKIIFVVISILRIFLFIPQLVLIISGGVFFGVYNGFILSLISLLISQSLIFYIGKNFTNIKCLNNLLHVNKKIIDNVRKYGYKLLGIGMICPFTPSDFIMLSAAYIKLTYKKSLIVTLIVNIPMVFLYNFLGTDFNNSILIKVLSIISLSIISYYSFIIWNKLKYENIQIKP
ncbi:MAG: VTT domain-containing protein [Clostridiales bacterium]